MKDVPSKIKCGGNTYQVELIKNFPDKGDNILGLCNIAQNKIIISLGYNGNKRPIYRLHESLLHECLHLVEYEWSFCLHHDFLNQFSIGLYQVLRENDLKLGEKGLPKKLKIGGMIYKIIFPYTFYDDTCSNSSFLADADSLEIKVSEIDDSGLKAHHSYISQDFLYSVLNAIYATYLNSFKDIAPSDEAFSCLVKGVYQVIVDNKLNDLFRKVE